MIRIERTAASEPRDFVRKGRAEAERLAALVKRRGPEITWQMIAQTFDP